MMENHSTVTVESLCSGWRRAKFSFPVKTPRKVNFTVNARALDTMLAEFMRGRRGGVSLRHYYLPLMDKSYEGTVKSFVVA